MEFCELSEFFWTVMRSSQGGFGVWSGHFCGAELEWIARAGLKGVGFFLCRVRSWFCRELLWFGCYELVFSLV